MILNRLQSQRPERTSDPCKARHLTGHICQYCLDSFTRATQTDNFLLSTQEIIKLCFLFNFNFRLPAVLGVASHMIYARGISVQQTGSLVYTSATEL